MSDRKNILFLTNRVPYPPDKGDKIRTFHQIEHLSQSHDVYCGCFVDRADDIAHARTLGRWCKAVLPVRWKKGIAVFRAAAGWLRGMTMTHAAYRDKEMAYRLGKWGRSVRFDASVAFSTIMAPYALEVPAQRRVLDMCDVDSEKWFDYAKRARYPLSAVFHAEARRLRNFERACLDTFDATLLISDRERSLIDSPSRPNTLYVVPNGVRQDANDMTSKQPCDPVIGFVGAMNYRPNVEGIVWFVEKVWPRILSTIPEARLLIVGRNPTWRVRRLARVSGIEVTGEIPDVRPYLRRCRVVVAPLHIARGLQNKVLEAMAEHKPVVATSAVAGGLKAVLGQDILIADDSERFATAVAELCHSQDLNRRISEGGHQCVAKHYSWTKILPRYEQLVLGEPVDSAQNPPVDRIGSLSLTAGGISSISMSMRRMDRGIRIGPSTRFPSGRG